MDGYFYKSILQNKLVCFLVVLLFSFSMLDMPLGIFGVQEIRDFDCLLQMKTKVEKKKNILLRRKTISPVKTRLISKIKSQIYYIKSLLKKQFVLFKAIETDYIRSEIQSKIYKGKFLIAYSFCC